MPEKPPLKPGRKAIEGEALDTRSRVQRYRKRLREEGQRQLTIYVPKAHVERIDELAKRRETTRNALIAQAIERFLKHAQ